MSRKIWDVQPRMTNASFTALSSLVTEGNVAVLHSFLESKRCNPDERDEIGQTLLMLACQTGQMCVIQELLRQGADINAEDYDNWTPLLNAAKEGYVDIVTELVECGADIHHRDMGGWTALMWTSYKGHTEIARFLLDHCAMPNIYDQNHISCLVWAAGRGHTQIVRDLINHGAKVNSGDKNGTTPLVWACRKGYLEIVDQLLEAGANPDTAGMYSWTPLIVATKGNYSDVVNLLLNFSPNVNAVDMDGGTALTIACKEGFTDIAVALLNAGAYVNLQDRNGDTNLIHATRAGHFPVVDALLKKYADTDVQGTDKKTAFYWAVEKGYVDIVRIILAANPNLEIPTKDGDTPLMKATRNRNIEIVQMLVDKKAKVSTQDRKGDTALHIAMRARSKAIVEILLRNPKNSQLLYRPNRSGETPYNIDTSHQKCILSQIFGARRLNTNEDSENMLGYDLYSSALADILSEPSLSMPISVGLYARWGSGKSFLLDKLEDEMRSFCVQWLESVYEFSWLVFLVVIFIATTMGLITMLTTSLWSVGLSVGAGICVSSYIVLAMVKYGSLQYEWNWACKASLYLGTKLNSLSTLLKVVFCHPPTGRTDKNTSCVRFLFTDQTKVSASAGDTSVANIVSSLFSAIEDEFGFLTTRLYRVFRPKPVSSQTWKWRRLCCIPYFVIFLAILGCIVAAVILLITTEVNGEVEPEMDEMDENVDELDDDITKTSYVPKLYMGSKPIIIALACVVGLAIISNLQMLVRLVISLFVSHQRRIHHNLHRGSGDNNEGRLSILKSEVETMTTLVKCLDGFVEQQTRLVVIFDGLDSCEQEKVLRVLDAVHLLFSDVNAPFVVILAIDPHIIVKAIESNIHRIFRNSNIRGPDYLRNIVHLPFYLQNSGLRRVRAAQQTAAITAKRSTSYWNEEKECDRAATTMPSTRKSSISSASIPDNLRKGRKGNHKLRASDSMASSISNLHRIVTGAQDLTKVLLTDDYFSDVNPRSMRRLMNIVYITGRLLKAFNIDFNWYHLASWINITEQWPYRTSWIILYYEAHESELEDNSSLKAIYEKVKPYIPVSKEVDPMLDFDHDERKFEVVLSFHTSNLLVGGLKIFLPFTINLDPYIRKKIQEEHLNLGDITRLEGQLVPRGHHTHNSSVFQVFPPSMWPTPSLSRPSKDFSVIEGQLLTMRGAPVGAAASNSEYSTSSLFREKPSCWQLGLPQTHTLPESIIPVKTNIRNWEQVFKNQRLSTLSVDGIISLLDSLEGVDDKKLCTYKEQLSENNINGLVLLTCDLSELKRVLRMSFGDWELFRQLVLALRENEYSSDLDRGFIGDTFSHSRGQSERRSSPPVLRHSPVGDEPSIQTKTTDTKTESSHVTEKEDSRSVPRSRSSSSALEKQVTMEETMIFGALETLNEEAQEDTLQEKYQSGEHRDSVSVTTHSPNPLSPIMSDPEEGLQDSQSDVNESVASVPASFTYPSEINVMYLKTPPHGSPITRLMPVYMSCSVPDLESAVPTHQQQQIYPQCSVMPYLLDQNDSQTLQSQNSSWLNTSLPLEKDPYKMATTEHTKVGPSSSNRGKHLRDRPSSLITTSSSSMDKLHNLKNKFIHSFSLSKESISSSVKKEKPTSPLAVSQTEREKYSQNTSSSSSSLSEDSPSKKEFKTIKKKHHSSYNKEPDGSETDDEQTPLVSPAHLCKTLAPPVETASYQKDGGISDGRRVRSQSYTVAESKSLPSPYHPRHQLQRQFSIETTASSVSEDLYVTTTKTLDASELPPHSPLHRQRSFTLAQDQPLTILDPSPEKEVRVNVEMPNAGNQSILHMPSNETVL